MLLPGVGVLAAALAIAGCGDQRNARLEGTLIQVTDSVFVGALRPGGNPAVGAVPVTSGPIARTRLTGRRPPSAPHRPEDKIDPALLARIAHPPGGSTAVIETLLVTFRENQSIPRFPEPVRLPRDSTVARMRLSVAQRLVDDLIARRRADYRRLDDSLSHRFSAAALEHGWLVRSANVTMPLGLVIALAQWPEVVYVEPRYALDGPPALTPDNVAANDPVAVADQTGTHAYLDAGYQGGRIALLDTGVMFEHRMLDGNAQIDFRGSCINADDECRESATAGRDIAEPTGHGVSTAAILIGDPDGNARFAGLTRAQLDCLRIYRHRTDADDEAELDRGATDSAIGFAAMRLDRVILVETQARAARSSRISTAAQNAFRAGNIVVAPSGNGGANQIGAPSNMPTVLSVGSYGTGAAAETPSDQSFDPNPMHLPKPDLQAPTEIETATKRILPDGRYDDDAVTVFRGTSAAAPVAAAAAALLREHLLASHRDIDPGQVMAALIACARAPDPVNAAVMQPRQWGAGRVTLPSDAMLWWGKVTVPYNQQKVVTLDLASVPDQFEGGGVQGGAVGPFHHLDVAIWWPEYDAFDAHGYPFDNHSDINLEVESPAHVVASSTEWASVWERVSLEIPDNSSGTWTLRVIGDDMAPGSQEVYVVAVARP